MKMFYRKNHLEAGVDEVARGCLAGRVYSAAVVWPKEFSDPENHPVLRDSKKLTPRRRLILKDYIEENAIDFSVAWEDEKIIDEINILRATYSAMTKALDGLSLRIDSILVDGDKFIGYKRIPYTCFVGGDDQYAPIAAASIIAKVYHDQYVEKLLDDNPALEKYGWRTNMCYGTAKHMDAIQEYGLTPYHRRTFGICKDFV